jgi:hypothetical protein
LFQRLPFASALVASSFLEAEMKETFTRLCARAALREWIRERSVISAR